MATLREPKKRLAMNVKEVAEAEGEVNNDMTRDTDQEEIVQAIAEVKDEERKKMP
jgi:hypothetical protein